MAQYTVFGGRGFIGSEIVKKLKLLEHDVTLIQRDDKNISKKNLGIVIYCSGCGDCENTPFDVLNANTSQLAYLLSDCHFDKLIYISSTRVYLNSDTSTEDCDLIISHNDNRRLFNLTKVISEELCIKSNKNCVIVRPSNVYGLALSSPLFLPSITRDAINKKEINMYVSEDYSKDYICVSDVAKYCIKISNLKISKGEIFNLAAGNNTTAKNIAEVLKKETGCNVIWHVTNRKDEKFPITSIEKAKKLILNYEPKNVLDDLKKMIIDFKNVMAVK